MWASPLIHGKHGNSCGFGWLFICRSSLLTFVLLASDARRNAALKPRPRKALRLWMDRKYVSLRCGAERVGSWVSW